MRLRALLAGAVLAATAAAVAESALAQAYPSRALRMVIPFPAGGSADLAGRVVAQRLGESLAQPVVVENRVGANGAIGAEAVARAAKDGYTVLLGSNANITINPHVYGSATFDPVKELMPVAMLSVSPLMLFVNPAVIPAASVRELVEYVKARPGKVDYASAGSGSQGHLAAEFLAQGAGLSMVHVPYKGGTPAVNDVLAGRIGMSFAAATTVLPHVRAGKLRGLATTGQARPSFASELPTMIEAGIPGFDVVVWNALFLPAGTPDAIVQRLHAESTRIANQPAVKDLLAAQGSESWTMPHATLLKLVAAENERWGAVVKRAGIKPD